MSRRSFRRLPDHIEAARMDTIALSLEIRHLFEEQWRCLQNAEWQEVVRLDGAIKDRAVLIQGHMKQMKRRHLQARKNQE